MIIFSRKTEPRNRQLGVLPIAGLAAVTPPEAAVARELTQVMPDLGAVRLEPGHDLILTFGRNPELVELVASMSVRNEIDEIGPALGEFLCEGFFEVCAIEQLRPEEEFAAVRPAAYCCECHKCTSLFHYNILESVIVLVCYTTTRIVLEDAVSTANKGKRTLVGQHFERCGRRILGGKIVRNGEGDIIISKLGVTVEVKASGNRSSYGFRCDLSQITRYEDRLRGRFSRGWYLFFCYENLERRKGGRKVTALSKHETKAAVVRYLRKHTVWALLLDLSLIKAWRASKPISTRSIEGHLGTPTIDIGCNSAHTLAAGDFARILESLNLDAAAYKRIRGTVRLGGRLVEFAAVVPLGDIILVEEALGSEIFVSAPDA